MNALDEIDAQIIRILCKDARTPFNKIGRMLNIGTDTVLRRYSKLKQEGKIAGSTVILSSKAIGIKGWYGFLVKIKQGTSPSFVKEKVKKIDQIYFFTQIIGDFDLYLEFGFREFDELDGLVSSLRNIEEILVIEPIMYASHDWPIPTLNTLNPQMLDWLLKS